jgi:hypothetical protein
MAEQEITSTKPELAASELVVHDSGQFATLFDTARFNQGWRVAQAFASSKMVPAHFQGNTAGVFVVLHMATRMELDPFMVLQNMYMVHGKPGMETKLALALVNTRGPFANPIAWEFDNEENPKKCTAFGFLKSNGERRAYTLEWDTVVKEKWLDKEGSKWKTLPKLMFMYRSAIFLIRTVCPEVILGLSTFDELQDINGEVVDVTPVEVTAKLIPQTEKIKEKLKRGRPAKDTTPPQEATTSSDPANEPVTPESVSGQGTEPEHPATATEEGQGGDEGPSLMSLSLVEQLADKGWPVGKLQIKFGKPMADWGPAELSVLADMAAQEG